MKRRPRVVHASRGYADYLIGFFNQIHPYVDLHVVLSSADEWIAGHIPSGIEVILSRAPKVSNPKNVLTLINLLKTVRSIGPDIIHYQSGTIWESLVPGWTTTAKVVTTVHDVVHHPHQMKNQFTPQLFLDSLAKRSDAIFVHGERLRSLAEHRYSIEKAQSASRIGVIDHPIITRYGIGEASKEPGQNILFFGGLAQWKGIETLLPAMKLLSARLPNAQLTIAGPSSMPDYYLNLPVHGSNVHWDVRHQSDADVARLFGWADIVVLPYIEASQSGVLHLANSFAVPVVASDVGALGESIKHEINGLLVRPGDIDELSRAMFRMLTDSNLRGRVVEATVAQRCIEISEKCIGKKAANFYEAILKNT